MDEILEERILYIGNREKWTIGIHNWMMGYDERGSMRWIRGGCHTSKVEATRMPHMCEKLVKGITHLRDKTKCIEEVDQGFSHMSEKY